MPDDIEIQKSLTEQIIEELLARIEGKDEFDPSTIQQLKELAQKDDLSKAAQVTKAIKAKLGENA